MTITARFKHAAGLRTGGKGADGLDDDHGEIFFSMGLPLSLPIQNLGRGRIFTGRASKRLRQREH